MYTITEKILSCIIIISICIRVVKVVKLILSIILFLFIFPT